MLQQAYILADFDSVFRGHYFTFPSVYQTALDSGSRLVQTTVPPFVMQCLQDPIKQPSFLQREEVLFYRGPIKPEDACGGPCEDSIHLIASEAAAAVAFIQSNGVEVSQIEHLGEVDPLEPFGSSAEKAKLLKENLALDETDEYVNLAQEHIRGNPQAGVEPDPVQAFNYYNHAAAQGNVHAMENLGLMYAQGIGTEQNTTKALELVNRAAEEGSLGALSELAYLTYHGVGLEANKTLALDLYLQAASQGHVESMSNAGVFFMNGEGTDRDYEMALTYFTAAAEGNHPNGIYNLALMYFQGKGTEPDCEVARELFYRVTLRGEPHTLASKAYKLYRNDDFLGAYLYYALAAFMGVESAQISAGLMWQRDQVPLICRNGPESCAASYYMLALEQHESGWAADRLADMEYKRGNYAQANEYYELSDSAYSLYCLGYLAQAGLGRPTNLTEAEAWYSSAIEMADMELYSWDEVLPAVLGWSWVKVLQWPLVSWVSSLT
jgi:SEL1 protein